ncbi:MAG TPA: hypothetical protein EYH08_04625 [Pyrodictium sp.]|nr:hypothetical protein [Pyrodictium sp.]
MTSTEIVWDGRELDWIDPCKYNNCCREFLRGVGKRYLLHPAFEAAFEKLLNSYRPKKHYTLLLIIPCSYGKPYSQSYIHYFIQKAIWEANAYDDVHQLIVTNAGVVPRELDEYWPWCAYDWNPKYETKDVKREYVDVLTRRLEAYIKRFSNYYSGFAAYLRWDSDSWKAVENVAKKLNLEIPNLAPRTVPVEELEKVSLGGVYEDPDLVLITPTALKKLQCSLRELLKKLKRG